jgi:hypothetical protein
MALIAQIALGVLLALLALAGLRWLWDLFSATFLE